MKDAQAVRQIAQEHTPHILDHGIVRAVRGQYIDVVLDGSGKQIHQVMLNKSLTMIEAGWWVTVVRHPRTNRWQAIAAYEDAATGSVSRADELPVPTNATATGKPYSIEFSWSGSFQDVATYEIQHNSSAAEAGATNLKVEGSNFLYYCAPGTTRHFRVRAVSSTYKRSAWSDWVSDASDAGEAYMTVGVNAGATAPEWQAFGWDNVTGVTGADMVHNHHTAAEGGVELWPDRLGVGTVSVPAMDGVIGLAEASGHPLYAPDEGRIYVLDDGGDTELWYGDDKGRYTQITQDGAVKMDHGDLSGLGDDDHSQYLLASGARDCTGLQEFQSGLVCSGYTIAGAPGGSYLVMGFDDTVGRIFAYDSVGAVYLPLLSDVDIYRLRYSSSDVDVLHYLLRLEVFTSETAAAGLGAGIEFQIEDDGGGWGILGAIQCIETDATAGGEHGAIAILTADVDDDGLVERWRWDHDGAITVAGLSMTVPAAWNLIGADNVADMLGIDDAGGLEFMRINSQNANPYVLFDPAAGGIRIAIGGLVPSYTVDISGADIAGSGIRVGTVGWTNLPATLGVTSGVTLNARGLNIGSDGATLAAGPTSGVGIAMNRAGVPALGVANAAGYGIVVESGKSGFGTTTPLGFVDIASGRFPTLLVGADFNADTRTNATDKYAYLNSPHYLNAEEMVQLAILINQVATNKIYIGGGSGTFNAATSIHLWTGATNTTTTGTERVVIDSAGVGIGTPTPGQEFELNGDMRFTGELDLLKSTDAVTFRNSVNNQRTNVRLMPQGTVGDVNGESNLEFFMTDYVGDAVNWERLHVRANAGNSIYEIFTEAGGTGTIHPLVLYTSGRANQLHLATSGLVGLSVIPSTRLDIGAGAFELDEMTAPGGGAANTCRIYVVDNGGKTELLAVFNTGAAQQLAIQP